MTVLALLSHAHAQQTTLFYGGDIITMADEQGDTSKEAKGVLVEDGKIANILTKESDVQEYLERKEVNKVNLQGAALMPGFIDPHMHLPNVVSFAGVADLSPCLPEPYNYRTYSNQEAPRFKDEVECVYDGRVQSGLDWTWNTLNNAKNRWVPFPEKGDPIEKAWIVGNGIDPSRFGVTPEEIERVAKFRSLPADEIEQNVDGADDHPVFILDQSGHVGYVNGQAFMKANICSDWPCGPEINRITKQEAGENYVPSPEPLGKWETYLKDGKEYFSGLIQEEASYGAFIFAMQTTAGISHESPFFFFNYDAGLLAAPPVIEKVAATGVTTVVNGGGFNTPILQFNKDLALQKDEDGNFTTPFRIRTLISATANDPAHPDRTALKIAEEEMTGTWPDTVISNGKEITNTDGRYGAIGIKFWADGSTQGCSAFLTQDYNAEGICVDEDAGVKTPVTGWHGANYKFYKPDNSAYPSISNLDKGAGSFYAALEPFWNKGWAIQIHTNGDKAMRAAAQIAFDLTTSKCNSNPVTLIHATVGGDPTGPVPDPVVQELSTLISGARAVKCQPQQRYPLSFIVSHLTGHVGYWGGGFVSLLDGKDLNKISEQGDRDGRAPLLDTTSLDVDYEIPFTLHSDAPIAPVNPLWYVEQMVTRSTWVYPNIKGDQVKNMPESKWQGDDNGRSVYENLKGITITAAEQTLIDDKVGSLVEGKVADLVILDRSPLNASKGVNSPKAINKIKVCYTYLAGKQWKPESFSDKKCGKVEMFN
ncbi:amidohydrolase family protein [Pseudovibrio sp. SCP19]|uniref:amidohydrolase family protein n=1 Tax=Pseudovibrio sp. SCP19 TaxID=3141374 RepID=UPI003335E354